MSPFSIVMERRAKRQSYPAEQARRGFGILALLVIGLACHTTPITGRHSLNAFSAQDDLSLGAEAYGQILEESEVVTSGPQRELVERVMERLARVADGSGFEWHVSLLQADQTVNAFALPGGKMAVYTGILPVCQGETGLAVVMGHEIGHVVARHGTERMTTSLGLSLVLSLLNSRDYEALAEAGLELFVSKPFGREQESEADAIGLIYMARAGYDPREAVAFWERMDSLSGSGPPEFLSTHPSHETRVERLRERLPEALKIWRRKAGVTLP